jgi:hypothetical protein
MSFLIQALGLDQFTDECWMKDCVLQLSNYIYCECNLKIKKNSPKSREFFFEEHYLTMGFLFYPLVQLFYLM